MIHLKVSETTSPKGYRVLYKNEKGRWERHTGQHFRDLQGVLDYIHSLDDKNPLVIWPEKGPHDKADKTD